MAGEPIAFSDLFDRAAKLAAEFWYILYRKNPWQILTNFKSLFEVISTSKRRVMLDIAAARERLRENVIPDIGFVRSSQNLADGLTKKMAQATLRIALSTGSLDIEPEQWIIRN